MNSVFDKINKQSDGSLVEETKEQPGRPNVTWQHVWSLSETRDAVSESSFASIPNEIMLRIFGLLSVPDLCKISMVCRFFKMIADQDEIWRFKCNSKCCFYYIEILIFNHC
jgi:hypothetical protein